MNERDNNIKAVEIALISNDFLHFQVSMDGEDIYIRVGIMRPGENVPSIINLFYLNEKMIWLGQKGIDAKFKMSTGELIQFINNKFE